MTTLTPDEFATRVAEMLSIKLAPVNLDRPLTRAELARHYGCSLATINRKLRDGRIPARWSNGRWRTTWRIILEAEK